LSRDKPTDDLADDNYLFVSAEAIITDQNDKKTVRSQD